jgi:hypothetical protein
MDVDYADDEDDAPEMDAVVKARTALACTHTRTNVQQP